MSITLKLERSKTILEGSMDYGDPITITDWPVVLDTLLENTEKNRRSDSKDSNSGVPNLTENTIKNFNLEDVRYLLEKLNKAIKLVTKYDGKEYVAGHECSCCGGGKIFDSYSAYYPLKNLKTLQVEIIGLLKGDFLRELCKSYDNKRGLEEVALKAVEACENIVALGRCYSQYLAFNSALEIHRHPTYDRFRSLFFSEKYTTAKIHFIEAVQKKALQLSTSKSNVVKIDTNIKKKIFNEEHGERGVRMAQRG